MLKLLISVEHLEVFKPIDEKDLRNIKDILISNDITYYDCDDVLVIEGRHFILDSIIALSCYYTLHVE